MLYNIAMSGKIITPVTALVIAGVVKLLNQSKLRKLTQENEMLKEKLRTLEMDSKTKQRIIEDQTRLISFLEAELTKERKRSNMNEQRINELETLIYNSEEIIRLAS